MGRSGTPRRRRLSRSGDFDRVFRDGRSHGNRYLVLYAFPNADDADGGPRLGISVGRKVGDATERNAVKRALREAFWSIVEEGEERDVVIVARPDAAALVHRGGTGALAEHLAPLMRAAAEERST
jgi:ribonuclease P protein component